MSIRLVLADDHAIMIDGLRALLRDAHDIDVVATASNGADALDVILRDTPDLALIDMAMPVMNGAELMRKALAQAINCRFIVLSMHSRPASVARALRSGASGYVLKESAGPELLIAIETVMAGEVYLSRHIELDRARIEALLKIEGTPMSALSTREREVIRYIVHGHTTDEIAANLGVAAKTVATYRSRIMSKVGVTNIAGVIRFAIENGLESL